MTISDFFNKAIYKTASPARRAEFDMATALKALLGHDEEGFVTALHQIADDIFLLESAASDKAAPIAAAMTRITTLYGNLYGKYKEALLLRALPQTPHSIYGPLNTEIMDRLRVIEYDADVERQEKVIIAHPDYALAWAEAVVQMEDLGLPATFTAFDPPRMKNPPRPDSIPTRISTRDVHAFCQRHDFFAAPRTGPVAIPFPH